LNTSNGANLRKGETSSYPPFTSASSAVRAVYAVRGCARCGVSSHRDSPTHCSDINVHRFLPKVKKTFKYKYLSTNFSNAIFTGGAGGCVKTAINSTSHHYVIYGKCVLQVKRIVYNSRSTSVGLKIEIYEIHQNFMKSSVYSN